MKIVTIPAPQFEPGDKVRTPEGMAVVDRDDLADILRQNPTLDTLLEKLSFNPKVHVKILEESEDHAVGDIIALDRYELIQQ